jgi:hypothetical protein
VTFVFVGIIRLLWDEAGFGDSLPLGDTFVDHGGKDLLHGPDEVEKGQTVDVGSVCLIRTLVSIWIIL